MLRSLQSTILLPTLLFGATTYAQVPPGYEVIDVHQSEDDEHGIPRMNDCGESVFHFGPSWADWTEILRYDNGALENFTENDLPDSFPVINKHGDIAWVTNFGVAEQEVVAVIGRAQLDLGLGNGPAINDLGEVVWKLCEPGGCGDGSALWRFNGQRIEMIVPPDPSNQSPAINNEGRIAWTAYDFSTEPGLTSEIMLYDDGLIQSLPTEMGTPQGVAINNLGQVAWSNFDFIDLWSNGVTETILEGHIPSLNDVGDIAYQFKEDYTPWQLFLLHDGQKYHISSGEDLSNIIDNHRAEINNFGEIVWWWNPNGQLDPSGIRMMRRIRNGDVDFDDDVDLADFAGPDWKTGHPSDAVTFADCLTGPVDTDRLCDCRFFDMGHDRDVDIADFAMFQNAFGAQIEYPPSYPPAGNCCEANPEFEPGCTSSLVEECVCEIVPSCCTEHWNESCALVADVLGCTECP